MWEAAGCSSSRLFPDPSLGWSHMQGTRAVSDHVYDSSQGSVELNPAGVPYGFFHQPLGRRFPDGYPVLLDTRLSALRAEQALLFLRDGRYLSTTLTK